MKNVSGSTCYTVTRHITQHINIQPVFKSGSYYLCRGILFVLISLCFGLTAFSQQRDTAEKIRKTDSSVSGFVARMKKIGENEANRSIVKLNETRIAIKQEELIENIKRTTQRAKEYLKNGIDTLVIKKELIHLDQWFAIAADGVLVNKGTAQTYRNLATTYMILNELLHVAVSRKNEVDKYEKDLVGFRFKIDSLSGDTTLYSFSQDSASVIQYLKKIRVAVYEIGPADTALKVAINNVLGLQTELNFMVNKLAYSLEETEGYQKDLASKLLQGEFAYLGGPVGDDRSFKEILRYSKAKDWLTLRFYSENDFGKIFLLIMLITATTFFLRALKQRVFQENLIRSDYSGQLVIRYPFLSALIIVLSLFQFVFPYPPFIFSCLFWIAIAVCLTIVFRDFITKYWMKVWLVMLTLFLMACANNLILQASRPERWAMLFLAGAGVITGTVVLFTGNKNDLREKYMIYFIGLVVLLELFSVIANIYGRYNMSKALMTTGYFNVVIGIQFLWTVRLINEALSMASRIYRRQERQLFYINFERVGDKAPALLYILLVIGWFILLGRNFYIFKTITDPIRHFLVEERTLGEYTFSINKLLVFFLILFLSGIISKIVSFFASDRSAVPVAGRKERKPGVGSWLLLIRVGIIGAGMFLAFAAIGLPMDRITIIVGALGVGVGFGLQTLVNNLVSGLIIAFEKPVNVGDVVEIAGQSGTMKSIGFRSSVISKWEGADVVIPNGELLNAHLVNWTLGGSKKRIDLAVGIAYGTDLQKAKQILIELLGNNENILKYPAPDVLFGEFGSSSILVRVSFWVPDAREGNPVKSEVIAAIDVSFKEAGIVIPFPQQDIHVHNLDADTVRPENKPS
jgi:potassium-dependent mechanosensitive channel